MLAHSYYNGQFTLFDTITGRNYVVPYSFSLEEVDEIVRKPNMTFDEAVAIFSPAIPAPLIFESKYGNVIISQTGATYNGRNVDFVLGDFLQHMIERKTPLDPLAAFIDKLMQNPSRSVVERLYSFLQRSNMPLSDDGYFYAYKIVNKDFLDLYTKKFDNSPGKVVSVERNEVDENAGNTCSHGLHVCGRDYLPLYGHVVTGTDKIVLVKISATDVVAIPREYNDSKMRVCSYEVLEEVTDPELRKVIESRSYIPPNYDNNYNKYDSYTDEYEKDDDENEIDTNEPDIDTDEHAPDTSEKLDMKARFRPAVAADFDVINMNGIRLNGQATYYELHPNGNFLVVDDLNDIDVSTALYAFDLDNGVFTLVQKQVIDLPPEIATEKEQSRADIATWE